MKKISEIFFLAIFAALLIAGCNNQNKQPATNTMSKAEQARQDSLAKAQAEAQAKATAAKLAQDSVQQASKAKADSIAMAMKQPQFVSNGNYSIQVGAWRSEKTADSQMKIWKGRGFQHTYVYKIGSDSTGDVWFRVRLGLMATRTDAEKEVQVLGDKYHAPAWVSRISR